MMVELQEIGRQQRLVEAERPSNDQIGQVLAQSIQLNRDVLDAHRDLITLNEGENPDSDLGWRFVSGSLAEQDSAWLRTRLPFEVPLNSVGEPVNYLAHPLVDPVRCALDFVQRFVRAAMDHLEAMGHLVQHDIGFRAPAVLSRAALEACAAASYLIDSKVSSAERLRRLWNVQCEQLTEGALRDETVGEVARGHRADILSTAESVGFNVHRVKPSERFRAPRVLFEDGKAHSSTLEMIEAALTADLGRPMWQGLSDVAHSRTSGLMFLDDAAPRGKQIFAMRTESIALHAMPALLAFNGLGDHLEEYLGWEGVSWREHFDPVLLLWNAGAGGEDDAIRQNIGLPLD